MLLDVARIGRSGVVLGCASAATARLLDLELGDVWLVAIRHRGHPLLLVLFVGAAAPLRYHRLAPIALLKIVGAVGHAALGRMERPHSSVLMIAAGQGALLGGQ